MVKYTTMDHCFVFFLPFKYKLKSVHLFTDDIVIS